jgi:hypothetical protein
LLLYALSGKGLQFCLRYSWGFEGDTCRNWVVFWQQLQVFVIGKGVTGMHFTITVLIDD